MTNAGIVKIAPATRASPDRRRSAGDVLFENASAEGRNAKQSHRDDGSREGCGNRLTCAHPEVSVCGSEHHARNSPSATALTVISRGEAASQRTS